MRVLIVLGLLALTALLGYSATAPNTPPDGSEDGHPYCMLSGVTFSNGLKLIGGFKPNQWNYQCSCSSWGTVFSTVVKPKMFDVGSTTEITFNGEIIHARTQNNAISNLGTAPKSPLLQSKELVFKTGMNEIVLGVACNERIPCYYQYRIKCEKPADGGLIVGDPQFVGLRGQSYQVHGVSGEVYNIISDSDLQYNARFVFLDQGECPVINGRKQKGCWTHPGSYLGELGLKTRAGDRIRLQPGAAAQGFDVIEVNGRALAVDESVELEGGLGRVSFASSHLATVQVGNWELAFENSDMFVNQRVRVLDARRLRSHGLLGQTWRDQTYPNAIKHIVGAIDDYVIRSGQLHGDDFVYNAFN